MSRPARSGKAGGAILAASIIGGVIFGIALGQPSIGFLIGTGLGILAALGLALKKSR